MSATQFSNLYHEFRPQIPSQLWLPPLPRYLIREAASSESETAAPDRVEATESETGDEGGDDYEWES